GTTVTDHNATFVKGDDYGRVFQPHTIIDDKFLNGKIKVSFPDGKDGNPEVNIDQEVMDALASVWEKSMVIKVIGHALPFQIMERKIRKLWKWEARMRVLDLTHSCFLVRILPGVTNTRTLDHLWSLSRSQKLDTKLSAVRTHQTNAAWLRITDLPLTLYEEKVLLQITTGMGKPIRVDPRTIYTNRRWFARICVELDLEKPLKVEYEGLPTIYFDCGRYGQLKNGYPFRSQPEEQRQPETLGNPTIAPMEGEKQEVAYNTPEASHRGNPKPGHHGGWMKPETRRLPLELRAEWDKRQPPLQTPWKEK
ncbi:hypothetical protein V2J09_003968, partial [Rumex salicifolius]